MNKIKQENNIYLKKKVYNLCIILKINKVKLLVKVNLQQLNVVH
jgi:hypothetical protein